jgi:hypothetical protein
MVQAISERTVGLETMTTCEYDETRPALAGIALENAYALSVEEGRVEVIISQRFPWDTVIQKRMVCLERQNTAAMISKATVDRSVVDRSVAQQFK